MDRLKYILYKSFLILTAVVINFSFADDQKALHQSFFQGKQYFYQQQYEKAVKSFESCLNMNMTDDDAAKTHFWLGFCYEKLDEPKKALVHYNELVNNYKNSWYKDGLIKRNQVAASLVKQGCKECKKYIKDGLKSADPNVKIVSVIALTEIDDKESLPILIQAFHQNLDPMVQQLLLKAIVKYNSPQSVPVFESVLFSDVNPDMKVISLEAAQHISPDLIVPVLENYIHYESDMALKLKALNELSSFKTNEARVALFTVFDSEHNDIVRQDVIQKLLSFQDEETAQELIDRWQRGIQPNVKYEILSYFHDFLPYSAGLRLMQLLPQEENANIKQRMLEVLNQIDGQDSLYLNNTNNSKEFSRFHKGSVKDINFIIDLFEQEQDSNSRLKVLGLVDNLHQVHILPLVKIALKDQNENIRWMAINLLEGEDYFLTNDKSKNNSDLEYAKDRADVIKTALAGEREPGIRMRMLDVSENMDTKNKVDILYQVVLKDPDRAIQLEAFNRLENLSGPVIFKPMSDVVLNSPDDVLRSRAIHVLEKIDTSQVFPLLQKVALKDPVSYIRMQALEALYNLDDAKADKVETNLLKNYY